MNKSVWAAAFERMLQLGDEYSVSRAVISETRVPGFVDHVWKFLDFDPYLVCAKQDDEIPEDLQFTQLAPKLKSKIQRKLTRQDFPSHGQRAQSFSCDLFGELGEIKKLTLQQSLLRTVKDTVYHYYIGLQQPQFALCRNCRSDVYFFSAFEAANLFYVFKLVGSNHYELYLFPDYGTIQGCAYFLFQIRQKQPGQLLYFRINNMPKIRFPNGWRPLVSSEQRGWERARFAAYNVSASRNLKDAEYYLLTLNENRNSIIDKVPKGAKNVTIDRAANCLVFNYQSDEETAFIASNYPYAFSRLISYLKGISSYNYIKVMKVGTTECFNYLPFIEIRHSAASKKLCVFSARMHAYDTAGSFALEGLIDFIIGRKNTIFEQKLREISDPDERKRYEHFIRYLMLFYGSFLEHFTVLVFPFVNIDGAILGNSTLDAEKQDLDAVAFDGEVKASRTTQAIIAKVREYVDSGLEFSHYFDFSESLSYSGVSLQTFETVSNQRLTQIFWQAAGNSGFLPFVDSMYALYTYFVDATVPRAEAENVQMDKLVFDNEDLDTYIASAVQDVDGKLQKNKALNEFVLPSIIFAVSKDIIQNYEIGPGKLSVCDDRNNLAGFFHRNLACYYAFKCIIGYFYGGSDGFAADARYFDIDDYANIGITVAVAIARQVKMNYELHNAIYDELRTQYLGWLRGTLRQAVSRYRTLSLLRVGDLPASCQTLMRFKLYALACPHDVARADKRLLRISSAIKLDLVFDLEEVMRTLVDSEVEFDAVDEASPEQVADDRGVIKNIIQRVYPLPEKKKKKGKKGAKK